MTREEAIEDIEKNILPVVGGKSLQMAIEALRQPEPKEELLDDGTLVLWTSCDMTKVSRVNVRQTGTHYGDLYYPDED